MLRARQERVESCAGRTGLKHEGHDAGVERAGVVPRRRDRRRAGAPGGCAVRQTADFAAREAIHVGQLQVEDRGVKGRGKRERRRRVLAAVLSGVMPHG